MRINGRTIPWRTIAELLKDKEARHGDALFAEISGRTISYRELAVRSRAIAGGLIARGYQPGDRIASLTQNCIEQITLWFGCCHAGLVWVPINSGLVGDDLTYIMTDSGARALLVDEDCSAKIDRIADTLIGVDLFATDDHPTAEQFSSLWAGSGAATELPDSEPSDTGAILYTGGTTGMPKGVELPQFSFLLAGIRYGEVFETRPGERHYSTMPLYHAGGLQWSIMGPLVNDMTVVVDRRFSASNYFARVRVTKANVIDPFGAVVTMLCNQADSPEDTNHSVRIAVGAVHGLPPHIPEKFVSRFNIPLINLYGLTEAGGAMLTSNRERANGSNGKPYGWVDIQITNADGGACLTGETGEIYLRPNYPHMFMRGYFHDAPKSIAVMRDCWLHTGDLGRLDDDGNLYFLGRQAHWLRRRGESISALEVETILEKHPDVREIAVVGVPSDLGEDDIKAFIIPQNAIPDPAAISEWALERMAAFKVPRYFEFVEDFPRSSAKQEIQRTILKTWPHDKAFDREFERNRRGFKTDIG